jgi:hypothetical protein
MTYTKACFFPCCMNSFEGVPLNLQMRPSCFALVAPGKRGILMMSSATMHPYTVSMGKDGRREGRGKGRYMIC